MKLMPASTPSGSSNRAPSIAARATVVSGFLIVSSFFGAGGFWAVSASIDSAVIAPGELIMEGNRTRVQHLEGGIIAAIEVTDGSHVAAGDPLFRLEDVRARAQVIALRAEYHDALGRVARLRAERAGSAEIDFPDQLLQALHDPQIVEVMEMQKQLFRSRMQAFEGQREILAARIPQYHSMIAGLDAQLAALKTQRDIFQEELNTAEELFEKGIERRPRILQLRRNVAGAEGEIGDLLEKRGQTLLAISEIEMRFIDMNDSRLTAIDEELTPLLSRLIDLRDRLRAAEDQLSRTIIRAPVPGIVVGLAVHNSGAVVQPGEVLLSIVPDATSLLVHARVSPLDVDLISAGQRAKIVLSAFKQSEVSPYEAEVVRVSADRIEDDRTGEPYFETVLRFSDVAADVRPMSTLSLIPGMPVEVFISTGSRSPLEYFLQPLRDSFRRAMRET
ncbi:HlyD family type I secretion periplasmic adaptor subunit [Roseinatronobacter sp. NSM]|uniref:HlyD family type I secretion periplasmic adaptor subunit n=1 Tax=Roseinatronobacter sp. NSM TaxID=3457785 RepID=UPI0040367515